MDRNHRISIEVRSIIPVAIVTRVVPETIPAPATVLLVVTILIVVWLGYLSFRSESLSLKALINFIPPLTFGTISPVWLLAAGYTRIEAPLSLWFRCQRAWTKLVSTRKTLTA